MLTQRSLRSIFNKQDRQNTTKRRAKTIFKRNYLRPNMTEDKEAKDREKNNITTCKKI